MTRYSLIREKIEEIWRWGGPEKDTQCEIDNRVCQWKKSQKEKQKATESGRYNYQSSNMAGCDMRRAGRGNWTDIDWSDSCS